MKSPQKEHIFLKIGIFFDIVALKINEKIPLISSDESNPDFVLNLMRTYLLPEIELLDSIREALAKYQDEIDRAYSRN